jgi:hypothetical protein
VSSHEELTDRLAFRLPSSMSKAWRSAARRSFFLCKRYPPLNSAPHPVHLNLFDFTSPFFTYGRTLYSLQFGQNLPLPPVPPCGGTFIS